MRVFGVPDVQRAGIVRRWPPGIPQGLFVVNGTNQEGEVARPTITGAPHRQVKLCHGAPAALRAV